jgi:ClpX C4-type zinc finger
MTLDEELLKKALAAGTQLGESEREALLARAEYHTAIRRLHLGGASLREIAQALSLSHQRVQQIVEAAGGTWWQRVWRTRTVKRDAVCTVCGHPPSEVAKLIAGPNVFICDACVSAAERTHARKRAPCSFCGKKLQVLTPSPAMNVCADCLRLCREILDQRAG